MKLKSVLILAITLVLSVVLGLWCYLKFSMNGFSARAQPSHAESFVATSVRSLAMPQDVKKLRNPVADSTEVEQEAMAHFADHCAVCHANNGSGETMFGNGMYPRPPDLRRKTQSLSDGELFYVIENGIRMSGMPAFGGQDSSEDSWKLVRFLRHLPQLSGAEEEKMESLNPKSPQEFKEEQEEEQFLNDGSPDASTTKKGKQTK